MRICTLTRVLAVLAITTVATVARGDDFDHAIGLAGEFQSQYEALRSLDAKELKELTKAICEGDEDEQDDLAKSVGSRVKDAVNHDYDKMQRLKEDVDTELDQVLSQDSYKERWDEAKDWKAKTQQSWDRISRMTEQLRAGSHPVVATMRALGQQAHKEYQGNSSKCTVSEWPLPHGRADCLYASDCQVIEIKPNNDRAVRNGGKQAKDYVNDLKDTSERKKLVDKASDFRKCTELQPKVVRYHACPEIGDDGEVRSLSLGWDD
jgi:hypothetical protein